MQRKVRVVVTGAGGFIGHHLVTYLKSLGYWVRGVDLKDLAYGPQTRMNFNSWICGGWTTA